jgi:hypothetical protein
MQNGMFHILRRCCTTKVSWLTRISMLIR